MAAGDSNQSVRVMMPKASIEHAYDARDRGWSKLKILDLRRTSGLEAVQRFISQAPTRPGVALQARVRQLARDMSSG